MSTYTQIIYQIVFGTKNREHTLTAPSCQELFKWQIHYKGKNVGLRSGVMNQIKIKSNHSSDNVRLQLFGW